MSDDKPKHKPSKKRTLEEVLKSLQDLIRNDIVPGTEPTKSTTPETPPPKKPLPAPAPLPSPAATPDAAPTAPPVATTSPESDEFNAVLDTLDELITHEIIEPVERARSAPPEAMTNDLLDLEEFLKNTGAVDDTSETDDEDGTEEIELIGADDPNEITLETPAASADDETLELIAPAEPEAEIIAVAPIVPDEDTVELIAPALPENPNDEAVEFNDPTEPTVSELAVIEWEDTAPTEPKAVELEPPSSETIDLDAPVPIEPAPEDKPKRVKKPTTRDETEIPVLTEVQEQFPFDEPATIPTVESETITEEFELLPTESPETLVPDNKPAIGDNFPTTPPLVPAVPERAATFNSGSETALAIDQPTAAPMASTNKRPTAEQPPRHSTTADKGRPAFDPTPAEDDIPVLQEIADAGIDLNEPLPLPGSNQARDIAIRVIAKLNIERRKAGEPALDIKSIERLQRILSDTLSRHETAQKPDDPHH